MTTAFQSPTGAAAARTAALRDPDGGQQQHATMSRNSGDASAARPSETGVSRAGRLTGSPGALPCAGTYHPGPAPATGLAPLPPKGGCDGAVLRSESKKSGLLLRRGRNARGNGAKAMANNPERGLKLLEKVRVFGRLAKKGPPGPGGKASPPPFCHR